MASIPATMSRLQSTPPVDRVAEIGSSAGMRTTARIVLFGTMSGLVWSLAPALLGDLFSSLAEVVTIVTASILTGISVSFALYRPLMRFSRRGALLLGIVSLPAGGFFFGVFASIVGLVGSDATGEPNRFVAAGFHPFIAGAQYALLSVISIFVVILAPSAVLTTLLWRSALGGPQREVRSTRCRLTMRCV